MFLAMPSKKNPKAFGMYIRRKKVARETISPFKDKGGNLCIELEIVNELPTMYSASYSPWRAWMGGLCC